MSDLLGLSVKACTVRDEALQAGLHQFGIIGLYRVNNLAGRLEDSGGSSGID
jgi:hypothetical protein